MDMDRQMSGMRMGDRQMSMYNNDQAMGIDQYYKRDDFGNYAYGYANGNSEKYEVGNPQGGVKGHYMYVDSNGMNRRVEYIADDQGFRIIGKEGERFKREADADMRMTSYMDSSMMDDDMYQMERAMRRNGMSMNRRMFDRQMFDRDMSRDNMMYRNDRREMQMNRNNMMDRDMQMNRNSMMDRDMQMNRPNMMDRDMMNMRQMSDRQMSDRQMSDRQMSDRQMSDRQMSDHQMSPNMMANNRYFDMYDMSMPQMRMDDGILGERNTMSQRMEIERIPDNRVSYMLF